MATIRHLPPHLRYHVGPRWPTTLGAYDYVLPLHILDCAWEFLRRNSRYQDASSLHRGPPKHAMVHPSGVSLQRAAWRSLPAEAWNLYCFR